MRFQNLKAFQKHLASAAPHHLCHLYFLAVADDFERTSALHAILSYLQTPDTLVTQLKGTDLEFRDLFDALDSQSLLGGPSIVVLDEVEKLGKKQLQTLSDALQQEPASFLLLGSRTKAAPLLNTVEKIGVVLDLTEEKPWDKEKRLAEQLIERAKNAGKQLDPDVPMLLFERLDKDAALLTSEMDKLISYVGTRPIIARGDVLAVSAISRTNTFWQIAEAVVWEKGEFSQVDANAFHALIPSLRSQLDLGLTLASLIESKCPPDEWNRYLPKIWPKTLQTRSSQAARLGSSYFRNGLEKLFAIELASRNNSSQYRALLDLFRAHLSVYGR